MSSPKKILVFGSFAYILKTTRAMELQLSSGLIAHIQVWSLRKILLFGSFAYIFKTTSAMELQLDWMIPQGFLFTSKCVLSEKYFYFAPLLIFSKPLVPRSCNLAEWFLMASCSHPSVFSQKIVLFGSFACIFKTTSAKELQLGWMIPQGFLFTSKFVLPENSFIWLLCLHFQNH